MLAFVFVFLRLTIVTFFVF